VSATRVRTAVVASVLAAGCLTTASAVAHDDDDASRTRLTGFEEVPAVSTNGRGAIRIWVNDRTDQIRYRLTYGAMSSEVVQAHIHFAQRSVNGGVAAFLCADDPAAPGNPPTCPDRGTVAGTVTPSDVIGPTEQGIAAGEFDALVGAMRAGVTYANVHSETFPNGEIRGQIRGQHHDDDDDDD
jgi:hypothetical protein